MKHQPATTSIPQRAAAWRRPALLGLLALCSVLAACTSSRSSSIIETARTAFESTPDPTNDQLNPAIRYLRTVTNGRILLLALGYIDSDRFGPIEVWYSGGGEVLRIQNGHVVGMTGTAQEWREVRLSGMPAWPQPPAVATFTRVRDTMPDYRFNVTDDMTLRATQPPAKSNLVRLNPADLRWFEAVDKAGRLPLTRIAVSGNAPGTAVYGEQCISPTLCVTWQQWPPAPQR
ncbi:MAG: hypothetical protein Q7T87_13325 [Polaromonas sp.]|nr:hypothetical protein [Polaromonas sp.]